MAHGHDNDDEVRNARESRNAALLGLGFALVWLAIVTGVSYALVGVFAGGGAAH